jgi:hypothetical protein
MSSNFDDKEKEPKAVVEQTDSLPQQLYNLHVSKYLNKDYIPFLEDAIRMVMIQFVIQFMFFLKSPSLGVLFSFRFVELLIYIILGVSAYWLIFKKLVFLS